MRAHTPIPQEPSIYHPSHPSVDQAMEEAMQMGLDAGEAEEGLGSEAAARGAERAAARAAAAAARCAKAGGYSLSGAESRDLEAQIGFGLGLGLGLGFGLGLG